MQNTHSLWLFPMIIGAGNIEAASLIVLAAIKETNGNARINLPEIFSGYGNAQDPYHPIRVECKEKIFAVHKRVSERLLQPVTQFENETIAALADDAKAYWLTAPLSFPDLADLPTPNQQFIDAVGQMAKANMELGKLLDPFVTRNGKVRPMPSGVRTAFGMAADESHEASREIDGLREKGLIGIRRPKPRGSANDKV